jgi:serine/threonine protein kinase
MSPEQIKSTKDVTHQSDIYSLGVVLWQMVMGKKPYDTNSTSTFELQTKIVTEKLSLTHSQFDTIIGVATAKELNFRYKNCNDIKTKLENIQKENSENTIAYTIKNSEKTIVDNSKDKTIVDVNQGYVNSANRNSTNKSYDRTLADLNNKSLSSLSNKQSDRVAEKKFKFYFLVPGVIIFFIWLFGNIMSEEEKQRIFGGDDISGWLIISLIVFILGLAIGLLNKK